MAPRAAKQRSTNNRKKAATNRPPATRNAGKVVVKVGKDNPHREGSNRFKLWQKLGSRTPYEKAVEVGKASDVRLDIKLGHLKLVNK